MREQRNRIKDVLVDTPTVHAREVVQESEDATHHDCSPEAFHSDDKLGGEFAVLEKGLLHDKLRGRDRLRGQDQNVAKQDLGRRALAAGDIARVGTVDVGSTVANINVRIDDRPHGHEEDGGHPDNCHPQHGEREADELLLRLRLTEEEVPKEASENDDRSAEHLV